MTVAETHLPSARAGWRGRIELGFRAGPRRTVLDHRRREGPLMVQRPFYPEGKPCHVYLLHPPGGVVGGDLLDSSIEVGPDAHALITNPGATQFYRSDGREARQTQHLSVRSGASLEWLPQENIAFSGTHARSTTTVELSRDAHFIGWEMLCMGRPSSREIFQQGYFHQGFEIHIDGKPVLLDRLRLKPAQTGRAGMGGHPVSATLVATPASAETLEAVRDLDFGAISGMIGCTLLDQTLVVRYLGPETEEVKKLFTVIRETIRPSVIGCAPHTPRIWRT